MSQAEQGKERSFEHIVEELETIAARLESGELPLEEAISLYEKGHALALEGQKRLDEAERRVEILQRGQIEPLESPGAE